MTVLVRDPRLAKQLRAERENSDHGAHDEVWEGVYIVSPDRNNIHQWFITRLMNAFLNVIDIDSGDQLFYGINLSDREDWLQNYRIPDLAVILRGNPIRDLDTHFRGGPDLVVEITSPGDRCREKLPFYARIGVREVLVIDRDPWAVELYRLDGEELKLVGKATLDHPEIVASQVLPVGFSIESGAERPQIVVTRANTPQRV
jgi:Uma2 family endonuclease